MSIYKKLFNYYLLFTGIICLIAFIIGLFVLNSLKNSEPFKIARKATVNNPAVQKLSGGITGTSFLINGMMDQDSSNFKFTVYGKTNDLWINCILTKKQKQSWEVEKLTYKVD